jgi:acyl carrier protein
MDTDRVQRKVIRIVSRAAMLPESAVTAETVLSALEMDSLDQIECALSIEEAFQVEIGEPELWRFRSVGDVVSAVTRALEEAGRV